MLSSRIASATRRGSSRSVAGGRPVLTAQNLHILVHTSPRIMNVAVPAPQHSPMFGQRASSQTVFSLCSRIRPRKRMKFSPDGILTLSQGGRGPRGAGSVVDMGLDGLRITEFLPQILQAGTG